MLAFNLARHDLGTYVNLVAKGDATLVEESGFPSYGSATPAPSGIPAAPQNLKLRPGDLSGSTVARCTPDRANSFNVAQICTGDPNVEANWHTAMQFSGGKVTISGPHGGRHRMGTHRHRGRGWRPRRVERPGEDRRDVKR